MLGLGRGRGGTKVAAPAEGGVPGWRVLQEGFTGLPGERGGVACMRSQGREGPVASFQQWIADPNPHCRIALYRLLQDEGLGQGAE